VKNDSSRAPENTAEHVRQLLKVNDQQAVRIRELAAENEKLRSERVVLNGQLKHLQESAA
jgi:cell division protein FtsB